MKLATQIIIIILKNQYIFQSFTCEFVSFIWQWTDFDAQIKISMLTFLLVTFTVWKFLQAFYSLITVCQRLVLTCKDICEYLNELKS